MMLAALRVELAKVFSKWRTFIGFIAVGVLIPIIVLAMGKEGNQYFSFATQALSQAFDFKGNLMNGYTVAYIVFGALYIHIPFLVTLVSGDILAGEATSGTYRLIFTRPVKRSTVITAKYLASMLYVNMMILWMAILAMGLGVVFLGTGEIVVIRSQITIIAEHDALWRFALAYGFSALSMMTVASIAFLCSSLVENSIGPIMTTMAVIIVFTIISAIDLPMFDVIRPMLFTNHMTGWKLLFDDPVPWPRVFTSASILFAHMAACFIAAHVIMQRKDILT